jgi:hypothetical protein
VLVCGVQVPTTWRPILEEPNTIKLFFDVLVTNKGERAALVRNHLTRFFPIHPSSDVCPFVLSFFRAVRGVHCAVGVSAPSRVQ